MATPSTTQVVVTAGFVGGLVLGGGAAIGSHLGTLGREFNSIAENGIMYGGVVVGVYFALSPADKAVRIIMEATGTASDEVKPGQSLLGLCALFTGIGVGYLPHSYVPQSPDAPQKCSAAMVVPAPAGYPAQPLTRTMTAVQIAARAGLSAPALRS